MEYGNRLEHVRRAALAGGVLGLAVTLFAVVMISVEGGWGRANLLGLLSLLFLPALVLGLVVGLSACFRIRVRGGQVQHVLLGRFVLSQRPVADFLRLESRGFPTLCFRDGRVIRFLGAHLHELARMEQELSALASRRPRSDGRRP
jgi:hypothetical protein